MVKINNIAVLMTCYNRREKTLNCLKSLFSASLPEYINLDVFLVDDGSTDGTLDAVKQMFPMVYTIDGTGNLYWNQGMRLAWNTAASKMNYEFYFWLNDDTILLKFALVELLECHYAALANDNRPAIITGACQNSAESNNFTYGGRNEKGPVIPNGKLGKCKYINGNATLIPYEVYEKLGNLSSSYTHTLGDFDYGLRAINSGFLCYTTRKFIAVCKKNEAYLDWSSPHIPIFRRWRLMNSIKGLNTKEYLFFRKRFWGWRWIIYALKAYSRVIVPNLYSRLKQNITPSENNL